VNTAVDAVGQGSAQIRAVSTANPSSGLAPAGIAFYTGYNWGPSEVMRIDDQGRVGINATSPSYPLDVETGINNISIYSKTQISATGYITRTDVFNRSSAAGGKDALSLLKDSSQLLNKDGTINHSAFTEAYVAYKIPKVVGYKNVKQGNTTISQPIYQNVTEEGVDLVKEISWLRQVAYELNQNITMLSNNSNILNGGGRGGLRVVGIGNESDSVNSVSIALTNNGSLGSLYTLNGIPLTFKTVGTERMRIDNNGSVGIGTIAPNYILDVNGSVGATAYYYTSDARLKKNITALPNGTLAKIMQLKPVSFNWINSNVSGNATQLGLIAQDVEKVFPEVVNTASGVNGTGYKSVEYGNLVAPIISAIQEQQTQISLLENKTDMQDKQINDLQNQINELKKLVQGINTGK
jgi:hypothetical protein